MDAFIVGEVLKKEGNIGNTIKKARLGSAISRASLAEHVGVSIETIARWERGERAPNSTDLLKLASALDTTVSYLLGETDTTAQSNAHEITDIIWVPVVSDRVKVCAGNGNAYPDVEWEVIDRQPFSAKDLAGYSWQGVEFVVMTVEGDSMEPIVGDGDKVLFAENAEITTGDIAVVALDGSIFIRGVLFNKDESIILRPRNQDYPDMLIDPKEQDFHVVGKVLKAIKEQRVGKIW